MKQALVRIVSGWGILLAVLTLASGAFAQAKIAVVDTQRAIMETEDGLRAAATMKKLFESKQRELDGKQTDLQKEREDIEKQRSILSKDAFAKRLDTWQRDIAQLQGMFVQYQKDIQAKESELTQPVFQKIMGLIRRLASQEGFDMVVDKRSVPYVRSDLDVTDRVITLYNQSAPAGPADAAKGAVKESPKGAKASAPAKATPDKAAAPKPAGASPAAAPKPSAAPSTPAPAKSAP